jgi:heat shock protein HslJ
LDYYYQGLTTDGRYYVSLKWPVSTESLPNTAAEAPEDMVTRAQDPNTYPAYVQDTKDVLNALPSSAFNPDLVRLNAMVQSLMLPEPAPSPEDEEEIALPPPDTGDATGMVIAPDGIFLRLGPGTDYPYIGAAPFGATGEIIGRSQDGQWWVVNADNVPEAPDGQVWVSAAFVEVTQAGNVPIIPAPSLPSSLTDVTWQWVSFADPSGEITIADPSRYTITFGEAVDVMGPAAINADCNNVSATYTVDGSSIRIVAGPSTMAACPEDSLDQQFLANLGQSTIYFFEEGDLFLALNADAGTMHLSASGSPEAPPDAGDDIIFQLISYGPVGAEQALLEGTQITALFSETEVSGSAGCNNYTGTRTWVGDYFTIGPIAVTRQFCSEPARIMEQEQAYLTALEGVGGYRWVSEVVGGTTIVTAGQLFYTLPDGTTGVMNLIAQ